jgi:hypothetical protein
MIHLMNMDMDVGKVEKIQIFVIISYWAMIIWMFSFYLNLDKSMSLGEFLFTNLLFLFILIFIWWLKNFANSKQKLIETKGRKKQKSLDLDATICSGN